jgi:hypothetical protein
MSSLFIRYFDGCVNWHKCCVGWLLYKHIRRARAEAVGWCWEDLGGGWHRKMQGRVAMHWSTRDMTVLYQGSEFHEETAVPHNQRLLVLHKWVKCLIEQETSIAIFSKPSKMFLDNKLASLFVGGLSITYSVSQYIHSFVTTSWWIG